MLPITTDTLYNNIDNSLHSNTMLHIITETNNELKNRKFPLPDGIRKILQQTLNSYTGDKTVDGYKRLNNILGMDSISYQEMKRIKNFFDHYMGTDKSAEFILNGGEPMKVWVNNTLNTATKAVHDFKQAKKDAGISNAFIKHHTKDRNVKTRNKPTQKRIKTNNINGNLLNNTIFQNENKKNICITQKQMDLLSEAMNDTFSFHDLNDIKSYRGKYRYCVEHMGKPIGKGSSRAVFQISDERVLKLAINAKGIAQNREEYNTYTSSIFPEVFECDKDYGWVVSEYVLPARVNDFKVCFGLTFDEFRSFIYASGKYRYGKRYYRPMSEEQYLNLIENNEDLAEFDTYIGDYGPVVIGDIVRKCNLGLTVRNGEPAIVLLDNGFTEEVWNSYYRR